MGKIENKKGYIGVIDADKKDWLTFVNLSGYSYSNDNLQVIVNDDSNDYNVPDALKFKYKDNKDKIPYGVSSSTIDNGIRYDAYSADIHTRKATITFNRKENNGLTKPLIFTVEQKQPHTLIPLSAKTEETDRGDELLKLTPIHADLEYSATSYQFNAEYSYNGISSTTTSWFWADDDAKKVASSTTSSITGDSASIKCPSSDNISNENDNFRWSIISKPSDVSDSQITLSHGQLTFPELPETSTTGRDYVILVQYSGASREGQVSQLPNAKTNDYKVFTNVKGATIDIFNSDGTIFTSLTANLEASDKTYDFTVTPKSIMVMNSATTEDVDVISLKDGNPLYYANFSAKDSITGLYASLNISHNKISDEDIIELNPPEWDLNSGDTLTVLASVVKSTHEFNGSATSDAFSSASTEKTLIIPKINNLTDIECQASVPDGISGNTVNNISSFVATRDYFSSGITYTAGNTSTVLKIKNKKNVFKVVGEALITVSNKEETPTVDIVSLDSDGVPFRGITMNPLDTEADIKPEIISIIPDTDNPSIMHVTIGGDFYGSGTGGEVYKLSFIQNDGIRSLTANLTLQINTLTQ